MKKPLYLVTTASDRMGGKDDMEFTHDIAGIPDTPWITIYEVTKLSEKERKQISKQRPKKS